jgi:asparagine synthase (glutamine-hydrolysing)
MLEFTFRAEYAYDYGMPQWLARLDHAFKLLRLERQFLGRHKFCHYRVWYRDALANYVRQMLLDPRSLSRPYVQPKAIETLVQHHLNGDANYTSEIHRLITLELIHRQFFDPR